MQSTLALSDMWGHKVKSAVCSQETPLIGLWLLCFGCHSRCGTPLVHVYQVHRVMMLRGGEFFTEVESHGRLFSSWECHLQESYFNPRRLASLTDLTPPPHMWSLPNHTPIVVTSSSRRPTPRAKQKLASCARTFRSGRKANLFSSQIPHARVLC